MKKIKKTDVNIKYLKFSIFIAVSILIIFSFSFDYFISPIVAEASQPHSFGLLYNSSIFGIFWGIFFCGAYARFYKKIPGANASKKGIVLGLMFWLIISVIIRNIAILLLAGLSYYNSKYALIIIFSIFSLLYWPLIGFIVGKIWDNYNIVSPELSE